MSVSRSLLRAFLALASLWRGLWRTLLALSLCGSALLWLSPAQAQESARPAPAASRPWYLPESRPVWVSISGLLVAHHNRLNSLNNELRSNGYSTLGTNQPIYGLAFDGGVGRFRLAADLGLAGARSYRHPSGSAEQKAYEASVSLDLGYDVLQHKGFSVFPMLGAAGGDLRLSVDPSLPPFLPELFRQYPAETEIRRTTWSARALLGLEQRLLLWDRKDDQVFLVFGIRLGYVHQVSQSRWMFAEPGLVTILGGPSVDTSGPFLRLGLGFVGAAK